METKFRLATVSASEIDLKRPLYSSTCLLPLLLLCDLQLSPCDTRIRFLIDEMLKIYILDVSLQRDLSVVLLLFELNFAQEDCIHVPRIQYELLEAPTMSL